MVWGRQLFQLDIVFVTIAVVGLSGLLMEWRPTGSMPAWSSGRRPLPDGWLEAAEPAGMHSICR